MMIDFLALETLLPFLLVLAVVWGALETAGMFRNKALKTIIAVVLAFFAVSNAQVVAIINSILPYAAIFFVLIFVAGYVKRSLGGGQKDNTMAIVIIGIVLILMASVARAEGGMYEYAEFFWFAGVIAILAMVYAAYKMPAR